MKILLWNEKLSDKETADLAYWERNALALRFSDGWYFDDIPMVWPQEKLDEAAKLGLTLEDNQPRFKGWRRVLTLLGGQMTFHIPDDFDVGLCPQVIPNWDGHSTEEKWRKALQSRGVNAE